MFAATFRFRARRRGIILVVILGMLALLALIGVTFATFSGQARVNALHFSTQLNFPDSNEMMDYALSQLIDDTNNVQSVIRGHSLKRDMYGNDASSYGQIATTITNYVSFPAANPTTYQCTTSLLASDYPNLDFTRWILRLPSQFNAPTFTAGRTFEVLGWMPNNTGNVVLFIPYTNPALTTSTPSITGYHSFDPIGINATNSVLSSLPVNPVVPNTGQPVVLEGRFLRAFNGPGMNALGNDGVFNNGTEPAALIGAPLTHYANFRYNGNVFTQALSVLNGNYLGSTVTDASLAPALGDPNYPGVTNPNGTIAIPPMPSMDEDYDACDLENWFLAIQSADGQVVVPSFHRPAILSRQDWHPANGANASPPGYGNLYTQLINSRAASKILRPRYADGHSSISFPDLIPDTNTGKITFDVDNDGDNVTDSVWLDLGYPPQTNSEGIVFKPLFSFMVIGLNGRIPLNTAGNLQNLAQGNQPNFTQASHLGNSPSEVDMTFALQNAYDPLYTYVGYNSPFVILNAGVNNPYTQVDSLSLTDQIAAASLYQVKQTQLRNILTGTRLPDPNYDPNNPSQPLKNGDINWVMVNGQRKLFPNNISDLGDDYTFSGNALPRARTTPTVAGRWGEDESVPSILPAQVGAPIQPNPPTVPGMPAHYFFNNSIRAGLSNTNDAYDTRDDNFNTFDFWPNPASGESSLNNFEADFHDAAGALALPVERIRRFVTPIDVSGDGRIFTFGNPPRSEWGADEFGRVSFFHYFRPPGVLVSTDTSTSNNQNPNVLATYNPANNPAFQPTVGIPDLVTNRYHGYESHRNPDKVMATGALYLAAMPSDINALGSPAVTPYPGGTPGVIPSYSQTINSDRLDILTNPGNSFVSPALNEADEMNLYTASRFDAPFGPSDLEWLYRAQDVDGSTLYSRLSQLAPISFTNALDGLRRRRLFALESWETTNFVWANDNPGNGFTGNSRFGFLQDANMVNLGNNKVPKTIEFTPQIAHRDRKINLNYPLPVSNSPTEPVRQKWIRETYSLLKQILPPKAVDTPEELAQLSQYVVNLIDFRDPDATCTKFVNTDVVTVFNTMLPNTPPMYALQPTNKYDSSSLQLATTAVNAMPPLITGLASPPFDPAIIPSNNPNNFLIQYGMEFQPAAINEVLACQFVTKPPGNGNPHTMMYFELVNMLTKDAVPANNPDSSDLDLAGWDVVVVPDDGYGRPDPVTGQIPNVTTNLGNVVAYSLATGIAETMILGPPTPLPAGLPVGKDLNALKAANTGADTPSPQYYTVFGAANPALAVGSYTGTAPTAIQPLDLTTQLTGKENQYFWLYLRRPVSPFDASYDPTKPNDNRVVVDSFRFFYMKSDGTGSDGPPETATPGNAYMFSQERLQPFRGGHAVPPLTGGPPPTAATPVTYSLSSYGYSEQTAVASSGSLFFGKYGNATGKPTKEITHTLGLPNYAYDTPATKSEEWDYFVFNDRDFTSVVELLMVPSTAPGLFTKQFCEMNPPIDGTKPYSQSLGSPFDTAGMQRPYGTPSWATIGPYRPAPLPTPQPVPPNWSTPPPTFVARGAPHANPYLNDEFFYTASQEKNGIWPTSGTNPLPSPVPLFSADPVVGGNGGNYVGGPGGAGWYKMFDFFEVPSPAFGAIGTVSQGSNYDWLRQDLKPGLLNLNLIIDEEVFLALMGENFYAAMNQVQIAAPQTPAIVTQVDAITGAPIDTISGGRTYYNMANSGYLDNYFIPGNMPNTSIQIWGNLLKASFTDFLKLRHGGSGFIFGFGRGATGQNGRDNNGNLTQPIAAERPFHSLSYPDIDYTVLRPAALPPSTFTVGAVPNVTNAPAVPLNQTLLPANPSPPWVSGNPLPGAMPTPVLNNNTYTNLFVWDPGVKNPYLFTANTPVPAGMTTTIPIQPPPIPPRRLFQISDWWGALPPPANPNGAPPPQDPPSNAGSSVNKYGSTGDYNVNNQVLMPNLGIPSSDMTALPITFYDPNKVGNPVTTVSATLGSGGNNTGSAPSATPIPDQRDHPYFRTEWLQKVTNLTTVRTHQYAVWITVGFFEVVKQGDPQLANQPGGVRFDNVDGHDRACDVLGLELGALDGRNVRYRSFFIVDRTKAEGFKPYLPGNFRDCVLYRQTIE
jgi:hypothetical protein